MSDHNQNERIYMRSNKPADEMTPEEIHAFAEEMYNRIMGTIHEDKKNDKN